MRKVELARRIAEDTVLPTPRQQSIEAPEASRGAPRWTWAKLLKRVFDHDLATCPRCQQGTLRIIAAITHVQVIRNILRHLKRALDPPPIAPSRSSQALLAGAAPCASSASSGLLVCRWEAEVRPLSVRLASAYGHTLCEALLRTNRAVLASTRER